MALKIDEDWVRQRLHLKHDNLDDVKSLSLPGSYHEKITYLGTSLHGFTRLKHLDLSRNSICNLEGISHLHMLETLNLYYNQICTLKDLYFLRSLINLKELDIRLNPVTKNEPDHRLFLVHMLPNLKKLDDRSVRDSERKAALMHFNTAQASEFTEDLLNENEPAFNEKLSVPRAELVRNLGPRAVLENDDVLLIDSVTKKDGDLARPNPITGSTKNFPDVQDYKKTELCELHPKEDEKLPFGGIKATTAATSHHQQHHARPTMTGAPSVQFTSTLKPMGKANVHELAPYSAEGNFTPTPAKRSTIYEIAEHDNDGYYGETRHSKQLDPTGPRAVRYSESNGIGVDQRPGVNLSEERLPHRASHEKLTRDEGNTRDPDTSSDYRNEKLGEISELRLLHQLLDLVDKYWNGSKSLHRHGKFRELAIKLLRSYQVTGNVQQLPEQDTEQLHREMKVKEEELARLSEHFAQQQEECRAIRDDLEKERVKQKQFETANEELATLHTRFKQTQDENRSLKAAIESQKRDVLHTQKQSDEVMMGQQALYEQNKTLRTQNEQQSKNLEQLNELTNMLQESHRSLVATNDHLLLELAQEKDRHQNEVNQLHWSYKQLKKSIDWIPTVVKGNKK